MDKNTALTLLAQTLHRIEGAYSPATLRAYRADFTEFIQYAEMIKQSALPANPSTVSGFILHLMQRGQKSASIQRSLAGIAAIHKLNRYEDPTKDSEVKLTMRRMHRQLGRYHHQAFGISKQMLDKMLSATAKDLRGERDRALLCVAYETLCRRAELLSLQVEDIQRGVIDPHSGQPITAILLKKSKTDPFSHGRWLRVSELTMQALDIWLQHAKLNSGPIFRGVNRAMKPTSKLDTSQLARIYKKIARRAGFNAEIIENISGHSTRVGAAQDLVLAGASLPIIMHRGRWSKTDTVMRYVEKLGLPV